jgi:hypothetical protein
MKKAAKTLGLIAILLVIGYTLGLVGIRSPRIIENQPLQNPQLVAQITGNRIELQDGRIFEIIEEIAGEEWPVSDAVIHRQIDLERDFGDDGYILYGNRADWICGTPWPQLIKIPIFRDDVYRNRREPIALAREITKKPKPNMTADSTASRRESP